MKNTEDQANASKYSLLFRNVLFKRRVEFLFQNVLDIIVSVKSESRIGAENTTLTLRVNQIEIIKCRLVCSSWNYAVKTFFERPELAGIIPIFDPINIRTEFLNPNDWSNPYIFTVSQPIQAQRFVSKYINGETTALKNPFLGRFMVINIGNHNRLNIDIFNNALTTILETFGQEIWYVNIYVKYSRFSTATEDYLKLRQILAYMPNLKSIRLHFRSYCIIEQETFMNSPLPELNKLFHLGVSNVGVSVLNEMFKKYSHVSYLQINKCGPISEWSHVKFTSLKGLFLDAHCQICCDDKLHWFGNDVGLENLLVYNRKPELRFCKQFEIIKRYWSGSLTALTLKIEGKEFEKSICPKNQHLKLLKLNQLKIYSYRNLCIDFVQTLKNLETLDVSIGMLDAEKDLSSQLYMEKLRADQKIQFVGFEAKMQVSNVWNILPKLKKISIKITHRQPILCYEYLRNILGDVKGKSFVVDLGRQIKLPHTNECIFENLQY